MPWLGQESQVLQSCHPGAAVLQADKTTQSALSLRSLAIWEARNKPSLSAVDVTGGVKAMAGSAWPVEIA